VSRLLLAFDRRRLATLRRQLILFSLAGFDHHNQRARTDRDRPIHAALGFVAGALLLAATVASPGYMSDYYREFDAAKIYDPFRALRRCIQGGIAYWHAWLIALTALAISFACLPVSGKPSGVFPDMLWLGPTLGN